jgi:hypothetical protein
MALAVGAWVALNRPGPVTDVQAQLDLRPYAQARSDAPGKREPLLLPRGRLTLNVILPAGFDPGTYDVQLLDSDLTSQASSIGSATTENFVTTLRTTLDIEAVSSGPYQLAIRQTGQDWQLFPAFVLNSSIDAAAFIDSRGQPRLAILIWLGILKCRCATR